MGTIVTREGGGVTFAYVYKNYISSRVEGET